MKFVTDLLLLADKRMSKTKLTAIVFALVNFAVSMGWVSFTPAQLESVNALLISLGMIFLRGAMDPGSDG